MRKGGCLHKQSRASPDDSVCRSTGGAKERGGGGLVAGASWLLLDSRFYSLAGREQARAIPVPQGRQQALVT